MKRFHSYPLTFAALAAAGGNAQQSFNVETGYDFAWLKSSAFVYDANGLGIDPDVWPRLTVIIQDGSTQQQLTTGETPIHSLFGSGQLPYILPVPHVIRGGATLNAQAFNRHGVTVYSVQLVFSGVHVPVGSGAAVQAQVRSLRRR